jgi:flagellar motor switch protein FliM
MHMTMMLMVFGIKHFKRKASIECGTNLADAIIEFPIGGDGAMHGIMSSDK